ncbi:NAD-dependent epimerase/dehydratase family protein, partial [Roseomonas sp. DSM 102946]|nr:NAD-dependent epimerase/dehydratase family protein [Roseomonas sp. DSM 102946]
MGRAAASAGSRQPGTQRTGDAGTGRVTGPDTFLAAPGLALREPVLVTGGAGFIGSNLADRLATEGHDILIYDALSRPGVE